MSDDNINWGKPPLENISLDECDYDYDAN